MPNAGYIRKTNQQEQNECILINSLQQRRSIAFQPLFLDEEPFARRISRISYLWCSSGKEHHIKENVTKDERGIVSCDPEDVWDVCLGIISAYETFTWNCVRKAKQAGWTILLETSNPSLTKARSIHQTTEYDSNLMTSLHSVWVLKDQIC
jgi:hypothetical protein